MNPMPELTPMLKELRLSGVMDSLEQRNRQAIEEKLAYTDFLALILQDELARRAQKNWHWPCEGRTSEIIKPLSNLTSALIRPSTGR
jgi:hypothetical protein